MKQTPETEQALERAIQIAVELKHRYVTPEHLLLAMLECESFYTLLKELDGHPKRLQKNIRKYFEKHAEVWEKSEFAPVATNDMEQVINYAYSQAEVSGREAVDFSHLLAGFLALEDSYATFFLESCGCNLIELIGEMSRMSLRKEHGDDVYVLSDDFEDYEIYEEFPEDFEEPKSGSKGGGQWKNYVTCLNDTCQKQSPLIGREKELERTMEVLCRMTKNNVLHIGEAGVGKTAIVYGLARKIEAKDVPDLLLGAKIYAIEMGNLLAGTQYRGDFEKRFQMIMDGICKETNPIIYLDEIHNIVGAGAVNGGSLDVSNLLKPYLSEGTVRFIGATTFEEYKKHFSKEKSLVRRFQNVTINEPSADEALMILQGILPHYEEFHGVTYEPDVLEYIVSVSVRHINDRYLPDKAIDLLDEAGAYRKLHPLKKKQTVDVKLVDEVLSKTCNIPKQMVEQDDLSRLAVLEDQMSARVFGQEEAVSQVVNCVKFSKAGLLEEKKPLASLLFVGPTGVGKTETARSLADILGISLVRFDMSEYAEKHALAKLIGSPAGYVGYEDGGLLTEEIRKHPHAVLLLDEIEKAHPEIYNVLLQIMDYATLTDNQGRKADFSNVILIMTSNAGAFDASRELPGFGNRSALANGAIMDAVKRTFQPEFRNRLQKIVVFHPINEEMAHQITKKKLTHLSEQLLKKNIVLEYSKEAVAYIESSGISKEYGAREIDRVITQEVKTLFADRILFGDLSKGGTASLEVEDGKLKLSVTAKKKSSKS